MSGHGGDRINLHTLRLKFTADAIQGIFLALLRLNDIDLIGGYDLRTFCKISVILFKFAVNLVNALHRVSSFRTCRIHHMDNDPGTLDMPQKVKTQSGTAAGTFNQAGYIRDHKAIPIVHLHNSQIRLKGCKGISGNFRLRVGDMGKKRGFSGIWKAYQSDIRNELQLQRDLKLHAFLPSLRIFRDLHRGSGIVHVSIASPSAFQNDLAAVISGHIGNYLTRGGVTDDGSLRNLQNNILAVFSMTAFFSALFAVSGLEFPSIAVFIQRIHGIICFKNNITAAAAVAAVRSACSYKLFTPEADVTVSALSGNNRKSGSV